jgi:hypothetical protein
MKAWSGDWRIRKETFNSPVLQHSITPLARIRGDENEGPSEHLQPAVAGLQFGGGAFPELSQSLLLTTAFEDDECER